jgi:hypothetical protein
MLSRLIARILVCLSSTDTLAEIERVILKEIIRRGDWRKRKAIPASGQIERAIDHLHRTLDGWRNSRP